MLVNSSPKNTRNKYLTFTSGFRTKIKRENKNVENQKELNTIDFPMIRTLCPNEKQNPHITAVKNQIAELYISPEKSDNTQNNYFRSVSKIKNRFQKRSQSNITDHKSNDPNSLDLTVKSSKIKAELLS